MTLGMLLAGIVVYIIMVILMAGYWSRDTYEGGAFVGACIWPLVMIYKLGYAARGLTRNFW